MIVSAMLAGVSAWIGGPFAGGPFEGERCEQCGRRDVLKSFRIEISFGERKVVREMMLCRKCMGRAGAEVACLPEDNRVH